MIEIETSLLVNQPIEKVFQFVTTPENDAKRAAHQAARVDVVLESSGHGGD